MDAITNHQYWQEIGELARSITEEAREYKEDINERLHETIDGHEWVIYTWQSQEIIRHSNNDGYSAENFGVESIVTNGVLNWAAIAFGCMYGDIIEHSDFDKDCESCDAKESLDDEGLCEDCREDPNDEDEEIELCARCDISRLSHNDISPRHAFVVPESK